MLVHSGSARSAEDGVEKRLYRSRSERLLWGVCGGLGNYFGLDPTVVRVIWVVMLVFAIFPAVLAYIILAIVIPLEPERVA